MNAIPVICHEINTMKIRGMAVNDILEKINILWKCNLCPDTACTVYILFSTFLQLV